MAWKCPYCQQLATNAPTTSASAKIYETEVAMRIVSTKCLNKDCEKFTVSAYLHPPATPQELSANIYRSIDNQRFSYSILQTWQLKPASSAKILPDYIPKMIREDYEESCLIVRLSPKASATLARRCLQGMIRDFCQISKTRLADEISDLRKAVENGTAPLQVGHDILDAMDHLKAIGNIGAHPERDINLIVEVEAGEAQQLISFLEILFEEWYIAREVRKLRLAGVAEARAKTEQKKAAAKAANSISKGTP